ncbi:hypothetical protein QAD02_004228 [Eretmocerus hayati]|uniref:Uncharacterized protein n=1 Tax=Eretmocerus hayati TaxID=131215 RepID=A0ACC2NPC7_9HYME|nr:hypothetical protein QAD02_004228 [Eretmocerus hayati]
MKKAAKAKFAEMRHAQTRNDVETAVVLDDETCRVLDILGLKHGFGLPIVPELGFPSKNRGRFEPIDYEVLFEMRSMKTGLRVNAVKAPGGSSRNSRALLSSSTLGQASSTTPPPPLRKWLNVRRGGDAAKIRGPTMPRPIQPPKKASEFLLTTSRQPKRNMLDLPQTRSLASSISRSPGFLGDILRPASSPATPIPKRARFEDRRGFVAEIRRPIMPRPMQPARKASELLSTSSHQLKREMLDLPRTQSPAGVSSTIPRPLLLSGDFSRPASSSSTPTPPKQGRL